MKRFSSHLVFFGVIMILMARPCLGQKFKFVIPPIDWTTGWAAGVKVSTTGPGIEGIKSINKNWNARIGFSLLPIHINQNIDQNNLGLAVDAWVRTGGVNLQADFHLSEWYYFTGGLWFNLLKADLDIQLSDAVDFGDISISPAQIGTFNVVAKPGSRISPYLAVGFGNPLPDKNRKFWFNVELGTWYHHKPRFFLDAAGMIEPTANIENEKALENNFKGFRFYPVFTIQGNYRIN
ncbi:MAG: hypothetical protein HOD37_20475 [Bacteroidetes bacterium]|nr:hypothetical protein [Bacteroidota bacterium]